MENLVTKSLALTPQILNPKGILPPFIPSLKSPFRKILEPIRIYFAKGKGDGSHPYLTRPKVGKVKAEVKSTIPNPPIEWTDIRIELQERITSFNHNIVLEFSQGSYTIPGPYGLDNSGTSTTIYRYNIDDDPLGGSGANGMVNVRIGGELPEHNKNRTFEYTDQREEPCSLLKPFRQFKSWLTGKGIKQK